MVVSPARKDNTPQCPTLATTNVGSCQSTTTTNGNEDFPPKDIGLPPDEEVKQDEDLLSSCCEDFASAASSTFHSTAAVCPSQLLGVSSFSSCLTDLEIMTVGNLAGPEKTNMLTSAAAADEATGGASTASPSSSVVNKAAVAVVVPPEPPSTATTGDSKPAAIVETDLSVVPVDGAVDVDDDETPPPPPPGGVSPPPSSGILIPPNVNSEGERRKPKPVRVQAGSDDVDAPDGGVLDEVPPAPPAPPVYDESGGSSGSNTRTEKINSSLPEQPEQITCGGAAGGSGGETSEAELPLMTSSGGGGAGGAAFSSTLIVPGSVLHQHRDSQPGASSSDDVEDHASHEPIAATTPEEKEELERIDAWAAFGAEVDPEWLTGSLWGAPGSHHEEIDMAAAAAHAAAAASAAMIDDDGDGDMDAAQTGNSQSVPFNQLVGVDVGGVGVVPGSGVVVGEAGGLSPTARQMAQMVAGAQNVEVGGSSSSSSIKGDLLLRREASRKEEESWGEKALAWIGENMTSTLELDEVQAKIVQPLQDISNEIGLKGEMKCFGSFMSGFANRKSDLDVTFIQQGESPFSPHDILNKIATKLESCGKYDSITKVLHAQSPLVRCTHLELNVEVEILMNNQLGVENSHLLHCYSKIDPRVAQLVRLVKTWAKNYEVLGSQDGCINSYAYVLLVLYYLVSINFLPNLQLVAQAMGVPSNFVVVKKWGTLDTVDTRFWSKPIPPRDETKVQELTIYQLVKGFFEFYLKFPWAKNAVCLRQHLPGAPPSQTLKSTLFYFENNQPSAWHLEDPFDVKHNLAGRTTETGRKRIIEAMKEVLAKLDNFEESFQTNKAARYWLKASISSTVTANQVLDIFKGVELIRLYFPKYGTFFDTDPNKPQHLFGAPRYKNIMLEFSSQAELRQAEMKNEVFLCESQLRLHKTTTGFVKEETAKNNAYYEFDVLSENLEADLAKATKERDATIALRSTESPKFKGDQAAIETGKGTGKGKTSDSTYYHLNLTLPATDIGGAASAADENKMWGAAAANSRNNSKHAAYNFHYGAHSAGDHLDHSASNTSAASNIANAARTKLAAAAAAAAASNSASPGGVTTSGASGSGAADHAGAAVGNKKASSSKEAAGTAAGGIDEWGTHWYNIADPQTNGSDKAAAASAAGGVAGFKGAYGEYPGGMAAVHGATGMVGIPAGYAKAAAGLPMKGAVPSGFPVGGWDPAFMKGDPNSAATSAAHAHAANLVAVAQHAAAASSPGEKGAAHYPSLWAMPGAVGPGKGPLAAAAAKGAVVSPEQWMAMMKGKQSWMAAAAGANVAAAGTAVSGQQEISPEKKAAYEEQLQYSKGMHAAMMAGKGKFAGGYPPGIITGMYPVTPGAIPAGGASAASANAAAAGAAAAANAANAAAAAAAAKGAVPGGKEHAAAMQIKGDAQYQMMMMASKGYMHPAMYAAAAAHPQAAMHPAFAAMAGVPKGMPAANGGMTANQAHAYYTAAQAAAAAQKGIKGKGGAPNGRGFA